MRKKLYALMASILALTVGFSAYGCGAPDDDVVIDPSKTQVYVSVFNGGFGIDWLNEAAKRFNDSNGDAQVIISPNKDIYQSQIAPAIKSGVSTNDIFITAQASCKDLGIQGYLEDLSDIWAADVDGNGKTVEQKMIDADLLKKVYQTATGTWGLPHSDAMQGFVYDHTIFKEKGFLMTESDGTTLTAGKDGKFGTYDDGQPVNETEWEEMINKMVADGTYPFIWTGMYASDYLRTMSEALLAQYDGLDNYKISFSYDGVYTKEDNTTETITPATGYKTIKTPAKKRVMDFIYKYLVENSAYYHPSSKQGTSHTEAQSNFILGFKRVPANPQSGMLYEGVWWENESRAIFNSVENRESNGAEYKYGTRDYRYMLFPNLAGQRGANGDGTGSVLGISESGTIFMKKTQDAKKREYAKAFIKYLASDEVSRLFTTYAGGLRPYNYELTDADKANMTVFAKNAYAVYSDLENITVIRTEPLQHLSEMNYFTTPPVARWGNKTHGQQFTSCYVAVNNYSPDECYAGMDAYANETYWNPIYQQYLALQ